MLSDELNLFLSISSFVVGILGLVSGAVFYLKGKSKKILIYRIDFHFEISPVKMPELKILFNEKPIDMLMHTTVTFTNAGNQTITSNDFAEHGQLMIKASKCFLGDEAKFLIDKDNQNSAASTKLLNEKYIWVYFDFLKEKESVKVAFYHEGDIDVLGELKSGKIVRKRSPVLVSPLFYLILFVTVFICLVLYWLCSRLFPIENFQFVLSAVIVFVFTVSMIYPLISFVRWLLSKMFSIFSRK